MSDLYLVWSHEHSAWWRRGGAGYTKRVSEAGRYSRNDAMQVCLQASIGSGEVLNELPVKLTDLTELQDRYEAQFRGRDDPSWM